jgi:hypothetical protein
VLYPTRTSRTTTDSTSAKASGADERTVLSIRNRVTSRPDVLRRWRNQARMRHRADELCALLVTVGVHIERCCVRVPYPPDCVGGNSVLDDGGTPRSGLSPPVDRVRLSAASPAPRALR